MQDSPPGEADDNSVPMIPTLQLDAVVAELDGRRSFSGISASTRYYDLGLLGDVRPLIAVLDGSSRILAGRCELLGRDARSAVLARTVGLAPRTQLPAEWTVGELCAGSAMFAGRSLREANHEAMVALSACQLDALTPRPLATLDLTELAFVRIARAMVGDPQLLVAEAPFADLDERAAERMLGLLCDLRERFGTQLMVSFTELPRSGPAETLADKLGELWEFEGAELVRCGSRESLEDTDRLVFSVTALGPVEAFEAALRELGARLSGSARAGARQARWYVELPATASVKDIVALAARVGAGLLELVPRGALGPETIAIAPIEDTVAEASDGADLAPASDDASEASVSGYEPTAQ